MNESVRYERDGPVAWVTIDRPDARNALNEAVRTGWLVPPRVALELLLTGEPIDATRAREVGLVNRVVPGDELHDAVQELAETVAANAPLSVRAAKEMVYRAAVGTSAGDVAIADAIWEPVYRSEDAQEGPRAFGERRPPQWKGR